MKFTQYVEKLEFDKSTRNRFKHLRIESLKRGTFLIVLVLCGTFNLC